MRQSMSNNPRRSIKPPSKLVPRLSFAEWAKQQDTTNQLARKG